MITRYILYTQSEGLSRINASLSFSGTVPGGGGSGAISPRLRLFSSARHLYRHCASERVPTMSATFTHWQRSASERASRSLR